jgi:putative inorganic carbon (HCO3(-)) transporter
MPLRDILIALIVFGSVPVALAQPYVGVLVWSWISFMNPHRLAYGFAYNFPWAAVIGGTTLVGLLFSRESKRLPMTPLVWVWLLFTVWTCIATLFALFPEFAFPKWERTMKIMLIALVTVMVMGRRDRLHWLIWVTVLSLGFYGVKGGIFMLSRSGDSTGLVWGPPGSFIEDNNALALALLMTVPLMRYLQIVTQNRWMKRGLLGMMVLTVVAIVGSYSRGAFLGGIAIGIYFWFKSRQKLRIGMALLILGSVLVTFVPSNWVERMETIRTYRHDASAMGRINAWWTAVHVSNHRPLVGGGFNVLQQDETFARYAPVPGDVHDAHSIYFEVLGEQGYPGLVLFLMLGILSLRTAKWVIRHARDHQDLHWARDLAAMIQVSLIGYAVSGAFLGLAYFDLYYTLVAMLVVLRELVAKELSVKAELPEAVDTGDQVAVVPDGLPRPGT